ncbi:hypothetical protein ABZP36_002285 [Zizania latifolia]
MEGNTGKPYEGQSLLADVEVSNLASFDAMAPSSRPQPSSRPLRHANKLSLAPLPPLHGRHVPRRSEVVFPLLDSPTSQSPASMSKQPVSISLPASPSGFKAAPVTVVNADVGDSDVDLRRQAMANVTRKPPHSLASSQGDKRSNSDRLMPPELDKTTSFRSPPTPSRQPTLASGGGAMSRDKRYDSFKTWSGRLERQISQLVGVGPDVPAQVDGDGDDDDTIDSHHTVSMPNVDRFFAALEGPELDQLRSSEELELPADKTWPFLLRFPVSAFGVCLGVGSQAILWKRIAESPPTMYLHVTGEVNLVLWWTAVALMCAISAIYTCKVVFFFEAVRREYYHPIRVNFFFAPWIGCLFLAIGVPNSVATSLPVWLWYALMAPLLCLELKIYGQWMSSGERRLSKVANPSSHLAVVGNFVGALLGASMGLREGPVFFFAVGLAHYVVLFVTLYQRLPTNETLPRELHPVFFLFVATPCVASMAWAKIAAAAGGADGEVFGLGPRLSYFVAMFLYASLAVRVDLFWGFKFSLSWWAYTFPMTSAAVASMHYSMEVDNHLTRALCVALAAAATLTVTCLFVTTVVNAFVLRNLFPNDIAIAITHHQKTKPAMAVHHGGDDDIESGATMIATAAA